MQDRDYYREWWAKKTGYVERAKFRLPSGPASQRRKIKNWHPVITVLSTVILCILVYWLLRTVVRLFGGF
jgi:hypothetical protein